MQEQVLINKLRALSPEKQAEVFDFVEFLARREENELLVDSAMKMSEDCLKEVWDNPEDAVYDNL